MIGCRCSDEIDASFESANRQLRVVVATPLGLNGRGGIDRLNDYIFDEVLNRPELNVTVSRLVTRGQGSIFAALFIYAYALASLTIAMARGRVDLVHIHLSNWGSSYRKTLLGRLARLFDVPYVVHLHGSAFDDFWRAAPARLASAIERFFFESDANIVLGQFWARVVAERVPQAARKIHVLPNATKTSHAQQIAALDSRVRITCLGQLGERKGTPQLIEALKRLEKEDNWIAVIAGDGKVTESRATASRLGLGERISIPGWLNTNQIDELLCKTDFLVLPSFAENLPMVILEAFAHGIPVISTTVGAIPEVVDDGTTGLLIPAGDVPALAGALRKLVKDPLLRNEMGRTARKAHDEKYAIDIYVSKLTGIWRAAVHNHRKLQT